MAEILMPVQIFWTVKELLRQADYMLASGEDQSAINEIYRQIFDEIKAYAISEKERQWLYDRSNSNT